MMSTSYLSNEHRREKREDERLDERDENLEEHDEQRHRNRGERDRVAEHEDQTDERENDDVAGDHVREETNRERERLRELSDDLHRRHDRRQQQLEWQRHVVRPVDDRAEVAAAEGAHTGNLDDDERHERERQRHRDVPRWRRAVGDEAEEIAEENEEEERQHEGDETLTAVSTEHRHEHVVPQIEDHGFQPSGEA